MGSIDVPPPHIQLCAGHAHGICSCESVQVGGFNLQGEGRKREAWCDERHDGAVLVYQVAGMFKHI